jgi:nitrite reductase/ring-hydroxylating ferredoxin subunit
LHDRVFNLATGEGIGVADGISVYPVRVDGDGNIMISVSQSVVS